MKKFAIKFVVIAAVIVLAVAAVKFYWPGGESGILAPLRPKIDEKATLSLLKSEALAFLVTRRNVTQLVVEHYESSILGRWQGVYWATVKWNWGVDLTQLKESDIRRDGEVIYCRLPEPGLLDFSIEPQSERFFSRSTLVPKLIEVFEPGQQRQILHGLLHQKAMEFAQQHKLRPSRQEMINHLNQAAEVIRQAAGTEIRFE